MYRDFDYSKYFNNPTKLADKVLELYFNDEEPSFPIDPFKMLEDFGVHYVFQGFKDLEGIYIAPEDKDDIAMTSINKNRPITRQRFTASHELCHHIKDRYSQIVCPVGKKNIREKFADKFASELLMPKKYLENKIKEYKNDGYVSFDNVIYIADFFGVSFQACLNTIAYEFNKIEPPITTKDLGRRVKKFKPINRRKELGLQEYSIDLLRNTLNSYTYFFREHSGLIWYRFKNNFVYNDNKLEGIDLSKDEISEIVTDLRLHEQESKHCHESNQNIIEVTGHVSMYDYIFSNDDEISAYEIKHLHKLLYRYSPNPELGGEFRQVNNRISGAKIDTVDYQKIQQELFYINKDIDNLIKNREKYSISKYVDTCVWIHHQLTILHPFSDGNGRMSRAMLNWLFKINNLPPVYINTDYKDKYYESLELADKGNYIELNKLFYNALINSMLELNKGNDID